MTAGGKRVALVSGSNRGIGAKIAAQLASAHDFLVIGGARDPGATQAGSGIVALHLDVTSQASVDAARERIETDPARLDVLVNNAGVLGPDLNTAEFDLDEAHRVLETNLFGAWRLVQAFLPLLRRSDDARIVNISSSSGQLAEMEGKETAYRVSKAGLNVLTRTLSAEEPGIRVNSVDPGWVRTDMGGPDAPRSIAEGADSPVWLATMAGPPEGGFFRDRKHIPW